MILRSLDLARCVVVVWSTLSVSASGEFVQEEVNRARSRQVLLPIRIEDVMEPLRFGSAQSLDPIEWDAEAAQRFAGLALDCVHKEYPGKIAHVLNSDQDVLPPRTLTPAFFGCYDWHSSVHGHWLLARLTRTVPNAPFAAAARAALARSLTPEHIAAEVRYLEGPGRTSFERPYGLAWLLQLAAELTTWDDEQARGWSAALKPLETAAAARLKSWLPKLTSPIRVGEHDQTAFAFGLVLDWARVAGDAEMEALLRSSIERFYVKDTACPLNYEPSGQDFLSPCLGEADLMRRVLPPDRYATWLGTFLPQLPRDGSSAWLSPAIVSDPSDPKLAHLDGLNLSRAWMLLGMARGLPASDSRIAGLRATAAAHREAGLRAVTGAHYEGGHWLGTFAVYLVTAESPVSR
jgi:hypothetical protein